MAQQPKSGGRRISLQVSTAQRPDFKHPLTAYLFDAGGQLLHRAQISDGKLDVTLVASPTRVTLGRWQINGATYNGDYAGPVLRVKPGDMLRLKLVNRLPQATNMHFHGLEVSPQGRGDNAMHMVAPGDSWDYEIPIPKDHPPGLYWFHTHAHSFAERQLMAGLSGTLIVEGFQDKVPATKALKERVFALKEFQADPNGDLVRVTKAYNLDIKTINGQLMPRIDIAPGETQLWRFSDQTANAYFRLALEGHRFLGAEFDNLRALLHGALHAEQDEPADLEHALRLASSLWRFWQTKGHAKNMLGWFEDTLPREIGRASCRERVSSPV